MLLVARRGMMGPDLTEAAVHAMAWDSQGWTATPSGAAPPPDPSPRIEQGQPAAAPPPPGSFALGDCVKISDLLSEQGLILNELEAVVCGGAVQAGGRQLVEIPGKEDARALMRSIHGDNLTLVKRLPPRWVPPSVPEAAALSLYPSRGNDLFDGRGQTYQGNDGAQDLCYDAMEATRSEDQLELGLRALQLFRSATIRAMPPPPPRATPHRPTRQMPST